MKYTTFFFILTFFIFACGRKIPKPLPPVATVPVVKDTLLSPSQYLSNRIPDCDKALVYMDSVIIPNRLSVSANIVEHMKVNTGPNAVEGYFNIAGYPVDLYKNNKYLYYINKECFIGQPSARVFKLFFSQDQVDILNSIDTIKASSDRNWKLIMRERGGFGITLEMNSLHIISFAANKMFTQSH